MTKAPLFILDIKANLTFNDVIAFLNDVTENGNKTLKHLYVALPFSLLKEAAEHLGSSGLFFGSPYLYDTKAESFTGPIAISLIKDIGATFVLIGSQQEKATLSAEEISNKLEACQKGDLTPILCIGETFEERQEGKLLEVLKKQISGLSPLQPMPLMIVYQIPFASFENYLPSESELKIAYQMCKDAASDLPSSWQESISWIIELPVDLASSSKEISSNSPFDGFYFKKTGVFPHIPSSEALDLFPIHLE